MTAPAVATPAPVAGAGRRPRTRRGVELMLLIFAMLVVLVYSAAVETGMLEVVTPDFWVPVAILFVIFLGVHIAIRFLAPYADPVLLPTVALINGIGVAFLRRLDLGAVPAGTAGRPDPVHRHGVPADPVDRRRRGRRGDPAAGHPGPPVTVEVRVHAGPGRHRAGDDPGPAAGEVLGGQRGQAVDPHRRLLDPARRVRQAGAAVVLRLLPGAQARGAVAGQQAVPRHRLPARPRPRSGARGLAAQPHGPRSSRRTSAPR